MVLSDGFEQEFARLRDEYLAVQEKAELADREEAPRFNVFRRFRLKEVGHSAFLADLLDPQGSHGQGDLFLRHFMRYCRSCLGDSAGDVFSSDYEFMTGWKISTEKDIRPFGRLDIVVENPDHGVLIVIENKVDASEGRHQMQKYGTWLQGLDENYSRQALLLLTPTGAESISHGGVPYYRLSYRRDIVGWLESALAEVTAVRIRGTLAQYFDAIGKDTMDELGGIQEFLRQPDNLPIAIDVAQQVERLRDEFHAQFWTAIDSELRRRLAESKYGDEWEVRGPQSHHRKRWLNCWIMPAYTGFSPKRPYALISFQQHRPQSNYRLHYGIAWSGSAEHPIHLAAYQALKNHLVARGITPRQGNWIFAAGTGYSPVGDRFLLRMGLDQDVFVREMVDLPWNLFLDTVDLLTPLNRALQEMDYRP